MVRKLRSLWWWVLAFCSCPVSNLSPSSGEEDANRKRNNVRLESSCANPAFTVAVACNEVVAADPDPGRGEGGASCDVAVLFDGDAGFAGAVSGFDSAWGESAGGGEVRPGGAIVWVVEAGVGR